MTDIAIFGDSIAWGSWDPEVGGWATRLRLDYMRRESEKEPDDYVAVHICAVPGHKSADVARRMQADLRAIEPDLVVVAVGINDSPGGSDVTQLEKLTEAYGSVLDQAIASGASVLALSTTNVSARVRPDQAERLPAHNASLAGMCADRGVPVVDLHGLLSDADLCADGLHPNAAGHEKIFSKVRPAVDDALVRTSEPAATPGPTGRPSR